MRYFFRSHHHLGYCALGMCHCLGGHASVNIFTWHWQLVSVAMCLVLSIPRQKVDYVGTILSFHAPRLSLRLDYVNLRQCYPNIGTTMRWNDMARSSSISISGEGSPLFAFFLWWTFAFLRVAVSQHEEGAVQTMSRPKLLHGDVVRDYHRVG